MLVQTVDVELLPLADCPVVGNDASEGVLLVTLVELHVEHSFSREKNILGRQGVCVYRPGDNTVEGKLPINRVFI